MTIHRYWVSWWSGYYISEGCTEPPFKVWISGSKERQDGSQKDDLSICAVIDAENENEIWQVVKKHFPDYKGRFCIEKPDDFSPGDRFPDFDENKTRLRKHTNNTEMNERIQEIKERLAATTQGTWDTYGSQVYSNEGNICEMSEVHKFEVIKHEHIDISSPDWNEAMANAKFIAHTRDDILWLIEQIEKCQ